MTRIQEVTITKVPAIKGGTQIAWNVDIDGAPFGQIWTFKGAWKNAFHVQTLGGVYHFATSYKAAEAFIRGLM